MGECTLRAAVRCLFLSSMVIRVSQTKLRGDDSIHFNWKELSQSKREKKTCVQFMEKFLACCSSIKLHAGTVHNKACKSM